MRRSGLIFQIGDAILVAHLKDKYLKAQIINFRAMKREPRSYRETYGCDVITEELYVHWFPMEEIVNWNKHKVKEWFE